MLNKDQLLNIYVDIIMMQYNIMISEQRISCVKQDDQGFRDGIKVFLRVPSKVVWKSHSKTFEYFIAHAWFCISKSLLSAVLVRPKAWAVKKER